MPYPSTGDFCCPGALVAFSVQEVHFLLHRNHGFLIPCCLHLFLCLHFLTWASSGWRFQSGWKWIISESTNHPDYWRKKHVLKKHQPVLWFWRFRLQKQLHLQSNQHDLTIGYCWRMLCCCITTRYSWTHVVFLGTGGGISLHHQWMIYQQSRSTTHNKGITVYSPHPCASTKNRNLECPHYEGPLPVISWLYNFTPYIITSGLVATAMGLQE